MLHAGEGAPTEYDRHFLIGRPEALLIIERMENAPFLLRSRRRESGEEDLLLDALESVRGPRVRFSR
ncbi:hypothetical protein [Streptomyces sp. NPDC088757]|uniref:hypothetical protein n=1 Tax=Streptomyces sp. NPDC088757 TaxID=3365889 RepID=UPI0037FD3435